MSYSVNTLCPFLYVQQQCTQLVPTRRMLASATLSSKKVLYLCSNYTNLSWNFFIWPTGLEIQNGNKTLWFDYGWCSFNQTSVRPFQCQHLTLHEATYPHYRLHRLTHKDSLRFFMSIMGSIPATLAVVLVNFDDTFRLSEKFVSGEGESPPVPVILVTNETGLQLAKLLEENPRDVKAVVHTMSRESASPSPISDPRPCQCFKKIF